MFPKFIHTATSEEASGTSDKQTSCSATSTPLRYVLVLRNAHFPEVQH